MTRREIANLCCRVLAVYALLQGIARLPYALTLIWPFIQTTVSSTEAMISALMAVGEPLLWLTSGAFLWRWSGLVAAWMIGTDLHHDRNEPEPSPQPLTATIAHVIAFSTVGLWVLVDALPRTFGFVMQVIPLRGAPAEARIGSSGWVITTSIELLLRLAIGLYLLFGASGLVRMIRSVKNVGLLESERPEYTQHSDSVEKSGASGQDAGGQA